MADVICVGILTADVVGKPIDELPGRGKLGLVDRMELHSGGCAANTGIGLAILGIQTAIIGKVGDDGFGDFLVNRFQKFGMEAGGVVRDSVNATSATMVMVHGDGERTFLHYFGANGALRLEDIDFNRVKSSKILHIAGSFLMPSFDGEPTAQLLKQAREAGVITSLDTAWDARGTWLKTLRPCLPLLDYFLPSFEEAKMLSGGLEDPADVAKFLIDQGVGVVGLKLGEQGSYIRTKQGDVLRIPVHDVEAIDALGAGDAFVAGFLAGLSKVWDIEKCARFANAVGACCVTALGATTGIKSFEETLAFMELCSLESN